MNRLFKVLKGILIFGLVILVAAGLLAYQFLNTPASNSKETVVFEVSPGQSFKTIARRLRQAGLVSSASKLQLFARLTGQASKTKIGEYAVPANAKPKDVLAILVSGKSIEYTVTVSEGLNIFEIADLVEEAKIAPRADFLKLVRDKTLVRELIGEDAPSLEGYLFPETYNVTKFTGPRGLVKMMVARFKENYSKLAHLPSFNVAGLSRMQLMTLASIVEKETGAPEERPVISSVFHNRMRLHMRLQTDPTVIYGIWEHNGTWNRNISRDDLQRPSPYNTYTIDGLPPGPIANPGFEAIKAAGLPAESDFLYFVSRNDGTHVFSKSYDQHQQAVGQFQLNRKAREGKSWRDLSKRKEKPTSVIAAPELHSRKKKPDTRAGVSAGK